MYPADRPRHPAGAAPIASKRRWRSGRRDNQLLRKVQLPLARPSIMLGVNQTIMMVLSVVIIAGLVGGGGLGYQVINGLSHDPGAGMVAGMCILLLAIVIDRITQALGQAADGAQGAASTGVGWLFGPSRARGQPTVGGDEIRRGNPRSERGRNEATQTGPARCRCHGRAALVASACSDVSSSSSSAASGSVSGQLRHDDQLLGEPVAGLGRQRRHRPEAARGQARLHGGDH